MTFVFFVIASEIEEGFIFQDFSSISTKTGVAPAARTASTVAMKVKEGTITSSDFFKSRAFKAISKAELPVLTPRQYFDSVKSAKLDSKF